MLLVCDSDCTQLLWFVAEVGAIVQEQFPPAIRSYDPHKSGSQVLNGTCQ
jgi:hypothetical protein